MVSVDLLGFPWLNNRQFQGKRTSAGFWKVSNSLSARFAFDLATATYRMATTGKTTKKATANLGFETKLGNISICGQEGNATTYHLASKGIAVFANDPAVPGSCNQLIEVSFESAFRTKTNSLSQRAIT